MSRPLRIALYTHSTNPRGGVVHTLELGDALARAGHAVSIFAPDPDAKGFFRATAARQLSIPAAPAPADVAAMVAQRIAEISRHIRANAETYDIHHAGDPISANALADCGIDFIRTVHHLDDYTNPQLAAWQQRGMAAAARCVCVSKHWRDMLRDAHGIDAAIVGNGVNLARFSPTPGPRDATLATRLGLRGGPIFLAIGGIEARKNSCRILQAFNLVRQTQPQAQLIIAGGASLLDHGAYQREFHRLRAEFSIDNQCILTGPLPDEDIAALYRLADVLLFPSLAEGFGLVVLEALASETPVVVSAIAPFTEYLDADHASFADPHEPASIAAAIIRAQRPAAGLRAAAAAFSWEAVAARHLALYQQMACADA